MVYSKEITEFYKLGVLNPGEEISTKEMVRLVNLELDTTDDFTYAFVTNQRVITTDFIIRKVNFCWDLDNIVSIKKYMKGFLLKKEVALLSIKIGDAIKQFRLELKIPKDTTFFDTIIENRDKLFKIKSAVKSDRVEKRLRKEEKKYEKTQKEEKERIQKDKNIDDEEDEEKEEEDEYANYSEKRKVEDNDM